MRRLLNELGLISGVTVLTLAVILACLGLITVGTTILAGG